MNGVQGVAGSKPAVPTEAKYQGLGRGRMRLPEAPGHSDVNRTSTLAPVHSQIER